MQKHEIDIPFRILSAIAIVLVVAGHGNFHIFDLSGLFPYYSFHVALFAFISGYFYKPACETQALQYIRKKFLHLMVPYFIWNLFYGIFALVLRRVGFYIGSDINLRTLLLEPFFTGHQFGLNSASWFVPVLFLLETVNLCLRVILKKLHLRKEWLIFSLCLFAGLCMVWLAAEGRVWGIYRIPGRIMFLLPVYQGGILYRERLKCKDRLPHLTYFLILLILQLALQALSSGLAYSVVWCNGFLNGPIVPYLTVFTGIAFWLRIARIAAPVWKPEGWTERIGSHTYSIMLHHMTGFLLVNTVFYLISLLFPVFADFDVTAFFSDYTYCYLPGGQESFRWLFLAAGIGVPLLISVVEERLKADVKIKFLRLHKN